MTPDSLLTGLRTGLTPFLGLPLQLEPSKVPGVVLGAPFDGGVLNRPGARLGPWALRAASLGMGRLPMPLRLQGNGAEEVARGFAALDWVDGGNIPTLPFSIHDALAAVRDTVAAWASLGARTLLLGGDHLMTLGALRALAPQHGPVGLLHFDAHPDAGQGENWGTAHHHGTWVRAAIEEGLLDSRRTVQIGLRRRASKAKSWPSSRTRACACGRRGISGRSGSRLNCRVTSPGWAKGRLMSPWTWMSLIRPIVPP